MHFIKISDKQKYNQQSKTIQSFQQKAKRILDDCYNTNDSSTDSHLRKLKLFISPKKEGNELSDKIFKAKFDFINRKEFKLKNSVLKPQKLNLDVRLNYINHYNNHQRMCSITNTHSNNITKINKTIHSLLQLSSNAQAYTHSRAVTPSKPSFTSKANSKRITFDRLIGLSNNTVNKSKYYFLKY